jgi:predicted peroxiredoxin
MRHILVLTLSSLLLMLALTGCAQQTPRDGVFIHLSHGQEDPHRVAMAFRMADLMSADHDVLVYCDIMAINVVVKDAPDVAFSHFPSVHAVLDSLLTRGVTVMACPGCMKVLGKNPEDLRNGVRVAEKDAFFTFTKGRILSIDY